MVAQQSGPQRIPIFGSGHEGYGDERRLPNQRQNSYHRVLNQMDMRWPGEMREGAAIVSIATTTTSEPPLYAVEWEDTVPNPLILFVADSTVYKIQAGAVSASGTLAHAATGAAMHDDGSGVPYLYCAEGGGNLVERRNRAAVVAACTNLKADKLLSLAGDLYITNTPAGGTASCAIGKVPIGTDPGSAAQPALTVIGNPGRAINGLASVRWAPICLKPDGIFSYDRNSDTWINHAHWFEFLAHPDTGKVFWYEGTDVCVALGWGGAVRFNGFAVSAYDMLPIEASVPGVDTTPQLLAGGGTLRHWGAVVTKLGAKRQRQGGRGDASNGGNLLGGVSLQKTTDGSTYTDYSTQVSDGDPTTYATLDTMPTKASNGWIIVGHAQPFVGVYFDMLNLNTNVSTASAEVWNGSAWVAVSGGVTDLTALANGASLGRSGWMMTAGVDLVKSTSWVRSTINALSRYWMRISWNVALSATVRPKAVELLPYRPAIDSTNFAQDAADRAGIYPHLLLTRLDESGNHVVHDMGQMPATEELGAGSVIYSAAGGTNLNDDRVLTLIGKLHVYVVKFSLDDRPQMFSWPVAPTDFSFVELAGVDLGTVSKVQTFYLDGYDFQRQGYLYYRFDDGKPWTLAGNFASLPNKIEVKASDRSGRWLHVAVGWKPINPQYYLPISPRITMVDADVLPVATLPVRLPRVSAAPVV